MVAHLVVKEQVNAVSGIVELSDAMEEVLEKRGWLLNEDSYEHDRQLVDR